MKPTINGMAKDAAYALLALCFATSCRAQFDKIEINDFFGGGAGAGRECSYKCSNGASPVPRDGHVPQSNGCGVPGFMIESHFGLTPCCHKHDICYHTCQTGKDRKKGQEKYVSDTHTFSRQDCYDVTSLQQFAPTNFKRKFPIYTASFDAQLLFPALPLSPARSTGATTSLQSA